MNCKDIKKSEVKGVVGKDFFFGGGICQILKKYQISLISKILILSLHIIKSKFMSEVELMLVSEGKNCTLYTIQLITTNTIETDKTFDI